MSKLCLLLLSGIFSTSILAQDSLILKGPASITTEELRDHMFYLASDELQGRLSGTAGYDKAVEYIITQFREAGISPVIKTGDSAKTYYQDFTINKYSPDPDNYIVIESSMASHTFKPEVNFITYYGGPFDTEEIKGGLVFVGGGIREPEFGIDDYKNLNVKGKWAVVLNEISPDQRKKLPGEVAEKYLFLPENRNLLARHAKEAGAVGLIFIPGDFQLKAWKKISESYQDFYIIPGMGQLRSDAGLPTLLLDSAMINILFAGQRYNPLQDQKSRKPFELNKCELTFHKKYYSSSIHTASAIGLIEGSDPVLKNEYITLCGHLDHIGTRQGEVMNGADDNASGSVGVLEIAEAITMSKPRRSVICMVFAGEELGLLGSYYFVDNPPVPLKNIIVNINLDMIGRSDTDIKALAPIGAGRITPKLKDIISEVSQKDHNIKIDWAYADTSRFVNMSDHYPFHLKKIPSVFFFSGDNDDVHQPTDDAEKIDYDFFQKSCRFVYEIIMDLANGEKRF
jgi:hypothetical protein